MCRHLADTTSDHKIVTRWSSGLSITLDLKQMCCCQYTLVLFDGHVNSEGESQATNILMSAESALANTV